MVAEAVRGRGGGGGLGESSLPLFLPFLLRVNIPEFSSSKGSDGFSLKLSWMDLFAVGWLNTGHFTVSWLICWIKSRDHGIIM